jgi:hypothetical protein
MTDLNSQVSIRDKYFAVSWSPQDTAKLEEYTKRLISMYGKPEFSEKYTELVDGMINLIECRTNDHHNATADLANHDWLRVNPLHVESGEDMVTVQGLNKLLRIYLGTASGVFKWVGRGTAAATPTPYSTALATETGSRQDSTTTGFQDIKGCSLRVFSSYATTVATATMHQVAIFDASTSGTMLALHDFGGNGFTHTINVDSFSLGIVIDMVPFGDV